VDELDSDESNDENSSEHVEEISTRAKAKGKVVASKSSSNNVNKKNNPLKKRKLSSTTSSPKTSVPQLRGNELSFPNASSSISPMS
ncbi:hypothetical protein MKW92_009273, partial [Papaver armeniacum]